MKHKGSISQAYLRRDTQVLPALLRQARLISSWPTTMHQLCDIVANLPTPFFCIADDAALHYIRRRHLHGVAKSFLSPYKQRLYEALWCEFKAQMAENPDIGFQCCVWKALTQPAPCVGLTPWTIQLYLAQQNKKKHPILLPLTPSPP